MYKRERLTPLDNTFLTSYFSLALLIFVPVIYREHTLTLLTFRWHPLVLLLLKTVQMSSPDLLRPGIMSLIPRRKPTETDNAVQIALLKFFRAEANSEDNDGGRVDVSTKMTDHTRDTATRLIPAHKVTIGTFATQAELDATEALALARDQD